MCSMVSPTPSLAEIVHQDGPAKCSSEDRHRTYNAELPTLYSHLRYEEETRVLMLTANRRLNKFIA